MNTKLLLALLIAVVCHTHLLSATFYSRGTGNWSVAATWSQVACGGAASATIPAAGDNVIICAGNVVTQDVSASCNWMEIYGTLTINATFTLTITGCDGGNINGENFTIDGGSPGTVTNNGTILFDQGACGGTPFYSNSGTFSNTGICTINNGGDYSANGTFINSATVNITSTSGNSSFTNLVSINNTGGTFNVNSGSTFVNAGSFGGGNGTININAGGTYQHAQNAGTIPTCTWNSTSTCLISGITNAAPTTGLGQSFGHFTWNCQGQLTTINLAGNLTTVTGNFRLENTGDPTSRTLQLATTTNPVINVTGNFVVASNGTDNVQLSTSGSTVLNVGGDFIVSGGNFIMCTSGTPIINIAGNFTFSSGATNPSLLSNGTGTGTINIAGNFNYTAPASKISESSSGIGRIFFNKAGIQTFSAGVTTPFINNVEVTVNLGSTLDMSASAANLTLQNQAGGANTLTVNGTLTTGTVTVTANAGTTFTLAAGGTLNTSNASGVNATILGVGTRTFSAAANYVLAGASTTTGFTGANTTMTNLTVTSSATLGETIIVNGSFLNSAGTFTAGTNTITVSGDFTNNATFNANTSIINLAGNFVNNSIFNANTGTIVFNDNVPQTIGGTSITSFNNITSSNTNPAGGVSLAQHANLIGTLTITSRTFTTTGFNFTLISNASGTASIAAITAIGADFIGDIIMQRYTGVAAGGSDWRFLCSAVSGRTISDWTDDFATSGFTGSTCGPADCLVSGCGATCNFVSIYRYDEPVIGDVDQGYVGATNVTNPLLDGRGYWVFLGPNPMTFDVAGSPYKFTQPLPVSFTSSFGIDHDGWNLVSNPYPSAIDWDDTDWTKTSMDNAVYIFNASNGVYATYVGGVGTNGGSKNIASQQAFWVKANTNFPVPVLTATEGVKITGVNPTYLKIANTPNTSHYPMTFQDFPVPQNTNTIPNSMLLTASGNGYDDETFIRFMQNATNNFDGQYDGWKLLNPNTNVQNFSSVIAGNKDLSINSLPPLTSNISIPIRLTVPVTGTYSIRRDSILMLPMSSCIFLEDKVTGSMIDMRTTISYSFTIADTTVAPRFILHVYAPITKQSVPASCLGGNNGMAIATGTGIGPWNYVWKDSAGNVLQTTNGSSTSDTLFNLAPGVYSVSVNGTVCGGLTDTIIINALSSTVAGFTASTYTLDISVNNTVTFTNNSSGATSYQWTFGDTSGINVSINPTHAYTFTGTYIVMLIASDAACSDTVYQTIVVINSNPTAINENQSGCPVNVVYDNEEVFLSFSLDKSTQVTVNVYNMIGEKIFSQNNIRVKHEIIKLDVPDGSAGIYIAVLEMPSAVISKKILFTHR